MAELSVLRADTHLDVIHKVEGEDSNLRMTTLLRPYSNIRIQVRREELECGEQSNADEDEQHGEQVGTASGKVRLGHKGVCCETNGDESGRAKGRYEDPRLHKHAAACNQHRLENGLSVTSKLQPYEERDHDEVSGVRLDAYHSVHQSVPYRKRHKQFQRIQWH